MSSDIFSVCLVCLFVIVCDLAFFVFISGDIDFIQAHLLYLGLLKQNRFQSLSSYHTMHSSCLGFFLPVIILGVLWVIQISHLSYSHFKERRKTCRELWEWLVAVTFAQFYLRSWVQCYLPHQGTNKVQSIFWLLFNILSAFYRIRSAEVYS